MAGTLAAASDLKRRSHEDGDFECVLLFALSLSPA
jgi:hypothetical protein